MISTFSELRSLCISSLLQYLMEKHVFLCHFLLSCWMNDKVNLIIALMERNRMVWHNGLIDIKIPTIGFKIGMSYQLAFSRIPVNMLKMGWYFSESQRRRVIWKFQSEIGGMRLILGQAWGTSGSRNEGTGMLMQ